VCEDDVRQAIRNSKKIYVGPKTIITPSARELANAQREEILVLAQR
jgi:ethanolamine utilization cobalamin adenosyltransferase